MKPYGFTLIAGLGLILLAASGARPQGAPAGEAGVTEVLGNQAALDAPLKDEDGNDVTLRRLIDKPTILTLNYFRCAGICTPLLNGLADSLNAIAIAPGSDFQVITVSFDPRDTPEIARQKRINYLGQMKRPFPPQAWRFLTGPAESTKQIADSVGFHFRADGDQFIHPGAVMVLSPKGEVTRYMYGISFLPADVEIAVRDAAAGVSSPSIARVLAFCYSYDPVGRRHVFDITRAAGAAILVLAGIFGGYLFIQGRLRKKSRSQE